MNRQTIYDIEGKKKEKSLKLKYVLIPELYNLDNLQTG